MTVINLPPMPEPDVHDGSVFNIAGRLIGTRDGLSVDLVLARDLAVSQAVIKACKELCDEEAKRLRRQSTVYDSGSNAASILCAQAKALEDMFDTIAMLKIDGVDGAD